MNKLTRDDLYTLEKYAEIRDQFRREVMAHKQNRRLELGEHVLLLFEDRQIMQYQIQEMLKAERIFEAEGIQEELDAYNPLIPDGHNWKCTMMIQYPDVNTRRIMLGKLIGIEDTVWMQVEGHDKIHPIADEDLERDTADKTSAVHFLRFELTPEMIRDARAGKAINAGVAHEQYQHELKPIPDNVRESLVQDLQ